MEGRRYMNTADKMSTEGGQRLDAWTGNGRDLHRECLPFKGGRGKGAG